jgi:hypothetical protein
MDTSYFDKALTDYEIKPVRETFHTMGGKIIGRMLVLDHIPEKLPIEVFYPLPNVLRARILNYIFQSDINICRGWSLTRKEQKENQMIQTFHKFPRYYSITEKDPILRAIAKEIEFDPIQKTKRISEATKRLVWSTYIGTLERAICKCCQRMEITPDRFECGVIQPEFHAGESKVSNLRPICPNCSSGMGLKSMEEFMSTFL